MGTRYWLIPITMLVGFVFTTTWDLLDGPDDIPPWFIDPTEEGC